MSVSVNRSSDSPQSSDDKLPEVSSVQNQHPDTPIDDSANATNSATTANLTGTMPPEVQRQQPIPPPSEPMQYRAIGLIRGQYMPSADQLTRGTLVSSDGTLIDAVLLGRVMSLVKNHLSLDQSHLWVVYPRTRQEDGNLHVQIVGVWEPEKLHPPTSNQPNDSEEVPEQPPLETFSDISEADVSFPLKDGYFSIRGEVIYQSRDSEEVIVKIKQSPRKESDKTKFFKLTLKGILGEKVIRHFWDLHVQLQANSLLIEEANDICMMPVRKPQRGGAGYKSYKRKPPSKSSRNGPTQRPVGKGERAPASTAPPPKRSEPLPKPVKRKEPPGRGSSS